MVSLPYVPLLGKELFSPRLILIVVAFRCAYALVLNKMCICSYNFFLVPLLDISVLKF